MIAIERILIPTDFSEGSRRALTYTAEFAKRFAAEVHLLHIVPTLSLPAYIGPVPDNLLHPEEEARQALDKWSDPALDEAREVRRQVVEGTPFVEIVRYARHEKIDLIVIGTHGHSGLAHALLGSVTEKVVRKAPCPVLTVRPEGHQFVMP